MLATFALADLLDYTDWQRRLWFDWLRERGEPILDIGAGPGGDGRFEKVGDLIRHIFSAEKRYVERLTNRPITDPATISISNIEALFQFGEQSRREFRQFLEVLPDGCADVPLELNILNRPLTVTPRKVVIHVLLHEVRHWAQIATLLRLNGQKVELHDFLFSSVLGDPF
ncbi:MAG: DinB family protein, partial [Acidobacteriia bacterium]|nr:DinB family protein [Terriglobia bacterium]